MEKSPITASSLDSYDHFREARTRFPGVKKQMMLLMLILLLLLLMMMMTGMATIITANLYSTPSRMPTQERCNVLQRNSVRMLIILRICQQ